MTLFVLKLTTTFIGLPFSIANLENKSEQVTAATEFVYSLNGPNTQSTPRRTTVITSPVHPTTTQLIHEQLSVACHFCQRLRIWPNCQTTMTIASSTLVVGTTIPIEIGLLTLLVFLWICIGIH